MITQPASVNRELGHQVKRPLCTDTSAEETLKPEGAARPFSHLKCTPISKNDDWYITACLKRCAVQKDLVDRTWCNVTDGHGRWIPGNKKIYKQKYRSL